MDTDLGHLAKVIFVSFSAGKLLLPPFPYCPLRQKVTEHSPHLEGGLSYSTSSIEYLPKLGGILLHKKSVSSPSFIYLLSHLLISIWNLYQYGLVGISFML